MAKEFFGSLPKEPKGKRLVSIVYKQPKIEETFLIFPGDWQVAMHDYRGEKPVAVWEDIPEDEQPTTMQDLVGEDGQKNVWIFYTKNSIHRAKVSINEARGLEVGNWSIRTLSKKGCRWSHSPFTPHKEANKFK